MNVMDTDDGRWDALTRAGAVPEPSEELLLSVQASVLRAARTETLRRDVLRRRRRRATRLATAFAAAASVLAVVGLVGFRGGPTGDPAVAAVLDRAASAVSAPPAPGPGQFLRVELVETGLSYVQGDDQDVIGAFEAPTRTVTYVPEISGAPWVRLEYGGPRPSVFYGGREVREAAEREYATTTQGGPPVVTRAVGGRFTNGELGGTPANELTTDDLADMPRDPGKLLAYLRGRAGSVGDSPSDDVVSKISMLLRSGLVPRDLQAAMYRVIGDLPDVEITHERVSLGDRSGTAIGVKNADGSGVDEVVVDPATGEYLGQRQVQLRRIGGVPAGTVMSSHTISVSIADEAP